MNKQELLNMELHTAASVDNWTHILRVYGGWIYQFNFPPGEGTDFGVFVPEEINCNTKSIEQGT